MAPKSKYHYYTEKDNLTELLRKPRRIIRDSRFEIRDSISEIQNSISKTTNQEKAFRLIIFYGQ